MWRYCRQNNSHSYVKSRIPYIGPLNVPQLYEKFVMHFKGQFWDLYLQLTTTSVFRHYGKSLATENKKGTLFLYRKGNAMMLAWRG